MSSQQKDDSDLEKRHICLYLLSPSFSALTGCPRSLLKTMSLQVKRHINQQQACTLHFILSIKVTSESFEALLYQERKVKRGEIDGWAARARHQRKVKAYMSVLLDRPRQSEGSRLPQVKLTETTAR